MSLYSSPVYIKLSEYIFNCRKKSVNVNIALVLLNKIDEFPDIYIEEIAYLAKTTPSTVSKFCKEIGYNSFSDMKQDYLPYINDLSSMPANLTTLEQEKWILDQIYLHIPFEECQAIAELIHQSKQLMIICTDYSFNISNLLREGLSNKLRQVYQLHRNSDSDLIHKFLTLSDTVILICLTGDWLHKQHHFYDELASKQSIYITVSQSEQVRPLFKQCIELSRQPYFFSSNYYSNKVLTSTLYHIVQLVHKLE